jgi:hypothetical protein
VEGRVLPVGDARHDLGLDVGLDVLPGLAFLGRLRGEELAEVAWLDLGDDVALGDGVEVVGDLWCVSGFCAIEP